MVFEKRAGGLAPIFVNKPNSENEVPQLTSNPNSENSIPQLTDTSIICKLPELSRRETYRMR